MAARAHDLEQQRHQASANMLSQAAVKQHPSDHLAASKAISEQLNLIGMDEYKLHGIATDALFNGVCCGTDATDHLSVCDTACSKSSDWLFCKVLSNGMPELSCHFAS